MKKNKPIYGRSQGATSQDLSKKSTTQVKPVKISEDFTIIKYNKTRSNKVAIKSLPRTIVQIVIFIAIGYWLAKNTSVGQQTTQNITDRLSIAANDAAGKMQRLDPTNLNQQRQQKSEDRFNDAWKKACGKDKDC
jgi:hypothetical protein